MEIQLRVGSRLTFFFDVTVRYECILTGLKKQILELATKGQAGLNTVRATMNEAVNQLDESDVYVQPEVLHGGALKATAVLEGEWLKSLDKSQRDAENKKKRIAKDDEKRMAKKKIEGEKKLQKIIASINKDPWKLKAIRNNQWTTMKSPPLEMFHWNRVVVDEFTYLKLRSRAAVHMGLVSKYRWSLSGTPPISHFADVKSIAASIGVHLGVHESTVDNKAKATTTALEKLQHFQHVRSKGWHAKR